MATVVFCDLVGSTGLFERLGDSTASHLITQLNNALKRAVEQHKGRMVKTLGDGIFAVFTQESHAVAACKMVQRELHERPMMLFADDRPSMSTSTFRALKIQLQIGIESGDIIEIDGDCFGDAVNSAARLADLAGAQQILTSQRVRDALSFDEQANLRSLGEMFLRGKEEATQVWRVNWLPEHDSDATMVGGSMQAQPRSVFQQLVLHHGDKTMSLRSGQPALVIGRADSSHLQISDPRVSRTHATLQARGNQFILTDTSSYGLWVYAAGQSEPLMLRRTECVLVGVGELSLGCTREADLAPRVTYAIKG
jgi:adenylate cyclase